MALPKIDYCILCEDMRSESGNKLTILGFYGLLPNVEVLIRKLDTPIRLMFLFGSSKVVGTFTARPAILNSDKSILRGGEPVKVEFSEDDFSKGGKLIYAFSVEELKFPSVGTYIFQLIMDDEEIYNASFNISQGNPSNFK